MNDLPPQYHGYLGRALILKEPAANYFARQVRAYGLANNGDRNVGKTVDALRLAEGRVNDFPDLEYSFSLFLFPETMQPFDNRVFSRSDTIVDFHRTPLKIPDKEFGKEMCGFTNTYRIALAGETRSFGSNRQFDPTNVFN